MADADRHILVVEDDATRRQWFRGRFAPNELDLTDDPSVAIGWLQRTRYDLLFLDHDLGRGDAVGRDVSTWLLSHRGVNPEMRIIVHSVNAVSAAKIERELREGARPVMRVPFDALVTQDG